MFAQVSEDSFCFYCCWGQIAGESHPKQLMLGKPMGELALEQLRDVLDAYSDRNAERAFKVWRNDEEIDAMYNSLFRSCSPI